MSDETDGKIGVMIATPIKHWKGLNGLHDNFKRILNEIAELNADEDCPFRFENAFMEGGIVRARNKIVGSFMARKHLKWLVFLDDDLEPPNGESIKPYLLRLLAHKLPIVGSLYCKRQPEAAWVANFMFEVELQQNGLLQVAEVGTGMKKYHREVFENLQRIFPLIAYIDRDSGEKEWGYFQHAVIGGDLMSEDYFCDCLCRMCKIGLWVDTEIRLMHRHHDGTMFPLGGEWPTIPGLEPADALPE